MKGADAASADTVPVADGAGSTAFQKVTTSQIDATSVFVNKFILCQTLTDVSAASTAYFVVPRASTLTKMWTCLQGSISVADSTVTVKNSGGSTAGTLTVTAAGSAAGDIDSAVCSSNNTFTAGQLCTVVSDGASSTTAAFFIVLEFTQTA